MADEEVKNDDQATPEEEKTEEVKEEATEAAEEKQVEEAPKEEPKTEEKPAEEPKEEKKEVEVPKKFQDLVKTIEEMSVLEMAELVKVLEEKFGVSAAAPVAVAAGPAAGAAPAEEAEEKSEYTVVLTAAGSNKIGAIKAVREINQSLGLKEAKDLVDGAPKTVAENVKKEDAEAAKEKLEAAGATVELK
ncbi:50S ribosomal protein L7/L12 [candidate division WS5 bacterium]|uniref:Large ribosomal subunit protein bL12 n=1 Tax=candidate division WS5 bacterium TaxID=2093353 RepID=A0A419DE85_9BACT|nr:MAG: 50S ribosomal protein L7/L12 [candidate division WS5 bacterium]